MSFNFHAAGKRADVIAALKNTETYGNQVGAALRDGIIAGLEEDAGKGGAGHEYTYVVKAFGHSGGAGTSPLSLTATVEAFYQEIPVQHEEVAAAPE